MPFALIALGASTARAQEEGALTLTTVRDIRFEGRRHIPTRRIWPAIKTRRPSFLPWGDKPPLRFDYLRADTSAIAWLYRQEGYLDAAVEYRVTPAKRPNTTIVTFIIHEGPRSTIGEVSFVGAHSYPVDQLRRKLYARPGRAFNPAYLVADTARISNAYQDRGYLPHVSAEARRRDLRVTVVYAIDEGPLYHFGDVYLSTPGEMHVKEKLIRRELLIKNGEVYRRPRIERSIERLYETGLFSQVQMTPLPDSSNRNIEVDLRVRERKFRWVDAGIGSGTSERLNATAEWGHRNLRGSGVLFAILGRMALDGHAKFQNASIEPRLVQPWLLGTRTRGAVFGYVQRRDDRTDPSFVLRQDVQGLTFGLNRELNRFTTLSVNQINEFVQQSLHDTVSVSDSLVQQTVPHYTTHRITFALDRDLRDNPFLTTRGSSQVLSAEIAGGPLKGSSSYTKYQGYSSWFTPTRTGRVFAMRLRAGVMNPFGESQFVASPGVDPEVQRVPNESRFRIGGVNSIRGYAENSIPIGGGLAILQATLELRMPVKGPFGLELYADMGNVWARPEYILLEDFKIERSHRAMDDGDVRYVFGVGPRLELPFGPLRLDFTWSLRPNTQAAALVHATQIAIGPSF